MTIEWTFGRKLLPSGQQQLSGMGDVRTWPSESLDSGVVCTSLRTERPTRILEVGHRRRGGHGEPSPEHACSRQCRATRRTGGLPPPPQTDQQAHCGVRARPPESPSLANVGRHQLVRASFLLRDRARRRRGVAGNRQRLAVHRVVLTSHFVWCDLAGCCLYDERACRAVAARVAVGPLPAGGASGAVHARRAEASTASASPSSDPQGGAWGASSIGEERVFPKPY